MNHPSKIKLAQLRALMQQSDVQACLIPGTDPHLSEYPPAHWKVREWISGFTGSAGIVVVTQQRAGLWTDSRYFLQAEEQLRGSSIDLYKSGLPDTPSPEQWLRDELQAGDIIGFDGTVFAVDEAQRWIDYFQNYYIRIDPDFAPCNTLWTDRPPLPAAPAFVLSKPFAGESAVAKLDRLRRDLSRRNCACTLLSSLDSIAWLLNLRGNDIAYNPVALAYLFVSKAEALLFIAPEKLTPDVSAHLRDTGVVCAPYENVHSYIRQLYPQSIGIVPSKTSHSLYHAIPRHCPRREAVLHPVDEMKAIKNPVEIAGIRRAMQRDGLALVHFLYWLDHQMAAGRAVTERDVSRALHHFRSQQEYFFEESFETIAAYGPHGAIVHYTPDEASNAKLRAEGLLLIDSGAQYSDGTTDITRTIALGPVDNTVKRDFTHVLKGHIQLALATFPQGTVGMQLDVLARQFLWADARNYLHGTGHGVGHFLNVHEGPHSIRMNYNPTPLRPGMIVSNEPGLYRTGHYGIRIENLLLVVPAETSDWGEFYRFETLSLCPIDRRLIDASLLSKQEAHWIESYHQRVFQALHPYLSDNESAWLAARIKKRG
jgi:Xaa-Pro aminopeptidase